MSQGPSGSEEDMADFVAVLKKTLDGLPDPTPETRQRVYARARATIVSRIEAMNPPPPPSVREMQLRALDDAVKTVEQGYAPRKPVDPLDELEDVFRSLNGLMNQPTTPAPKPASATPAPVTSPPRPVTPNLPPRPVLSERPPLPERPRIDPLPRRDVPTPSDSERLPPRPAATAPISTVSGAQSVPPKLPPVRDPSRPLPGTNASPVRETLRNKPPEDEFADFNLDDGDGDLPSAQNVRRGPEPRRALPREPEVQRSGSGFGKIAAAVIGLAALGGAAYGVWINKDDFQRLVGMTPAGETQSATPVNTPEPAPVDTAETPPPAAETPPAETAAPAETPPAAEAPPAKLTQRLNEDGSEVDMGPAAGEPAIGEGTSVAEVTPPSDTGPAIPPAAASPPTAADPAVPPAADPAAPPVADPAASAPPLAADPAQPGTPPSTSGAPTDIAAAPAAAPSAPPTDPAAPAADPAAPTVAPAAVSPGGSVAVAQKAIFYEERTSSAQGSAEPGTTVWSLVQESPGGGRPPEPAIKGVISVPDKDIGISLTIRRNADPTLPASHIIEMIFITPENSTEGGVENILRVALKSDEQQPGNPVIGLPAKIGDGFFLVALNNSKAEVDANMTLLKQQNWMDIAFVYKSGRRALVTMEKGVPGGKVFDEALKAWGVASAG